MVRQTLGTKRKISCSSIKYCLWRLHFQLHLKIVTFFFSSEVTFLATFIARTISLEHQAAHHFLLTTNQQGPHRFREDMGPSADLRHSKDFCKLRSLQDAWQSPWVDSNWTVFGPHWTQVRWVEHLRWEKKYSTNIFRNRRASTSMSTSDPGLKWPQVVRTEMPSLDLPRMLFQPDLQNKETQAMWMDAVFVRKRCKLQST